LDRTPDVLCFQGKTMRNVLNINLKRLLTGSPNNGKSLFTLKINSIFVPMKIIRRFIKANF